MSPRPQAGGKGREAELAKREAELNAREAELRRWEQDLRSSGRLVPKKNWPKCCPLTVMDIKAEVPADLQNVVTCAYWSYLVSCFADATHATSSLRITTGHRRMRLDRATRCPSSRAAGCLAIMQSPAVDEACFHGQCTRR